ncbi:MAG TPA: hypothetical protein VHA52_07755 [Candidatus Babeliaceae bacterium]|nr:hypothetical protein [Candidatus Babeliaceae bacterium]
MKSFNLSSIIFGLSLLLMAQTGLTKDTDNETVGVHKIYRTIIDNAKKLLNKPVTENSKAQASQIQELLETIIRNAQNFERFKSLIPEATELSDKLSANFDLQTIPVGEELAPRYVTRSGSQSDISKTYKDVNLPADR